MTTKRLRRAIGYVRVSSMGTRKRGDESFISEEEQRDAIVALATLHGFKIVRWVVELDESAKEGNARPLFEEALEAIEAGEAEALLVARMSRFSRSVLDTHSTVKRLREASAVLVAGDLNVDTSTPTGKLMMTVLAGFAQFELETKSEQWVVAKSKAIAKGKAVGRTPRGYVRGEDGRFTPDPKCGHLVEPIFEMRVAGASFRQMIDFWHGETGEWLRPQNVADMLACRTYLGEVRLRAEVELVTEGAHDPLVDAGLFDRAQRVKTSRPQRGTGSLLGGLMTCSGCGRVMTANVAGNGKLVYRCQRNSAEGRCPAPVSIMRDAADEYVSAQFLEYAGRITAEGSPDGSELEAAEAALEAARAELAAYLAAGLASVIGAELFRENVEARQAAIDEAQERVAELHDAGSIESMVVNVAELWPTLERDERRRLIAAAVSKITVAKSRGGGRMVPVAERVSIDWR